MSNRVPLPPYGPASDALTVTDALRITGCSEPHETSHGDLRWPCGLATSIVMGSAPVSPIWADAISRAHFAHHHYGHGTWPLWTPLFSQAPDGTIYVVSCTHYTAKGEPVDSMTISDETVMGRLDTSLTP